MRQIATANLNYVHSELVCKMLRTLLRRNLRTNDIEYTIEKSLKQCTECFKLEAKRKLMRMKIADAYRKQKEQKLEYVQK